MYSGLFDKNVVPLDDVLLPYKIFLQLIGSYVKEISPISSNLNSYMWYYFCELLEKEADSAIGKILFILL